MENELSSDDVATDAGDDTTAHGSIRRLLDGSLLVAAARRVSTAASESMLADAGNRLVTWTTNSYLYRWLTAEPDPEVVVIDLRETYTIGPFIRLLDGIIDRLAPLWQRSRLKQALERIDHWLVRATETRLGGLIASVLVPPEPPERSDQEAGSDDDSGEKQTDTPDDTDP